MVISNVHVYGLENAVRGSKFPMATDIESLNSDIVDRTRSLGKSKIGSGHDNFLNGIIVQFDVTFTVKAWTEAERYHWFDFISSQSTMHRITKFDLDKAYIKYVDPRIIEIMKEKVSEYNKLVEGKPNDAAAKQLIKVYNDLLAEKYLEILYSNPCGFKLTAAMTTNYRELKTMYHQRKNHRLPEWKTFCKQVEELPHFKELILGDTND